MSRPERREQLRRERAAKDEQRSRENAAIREHIETLYHDIVERLRALGIDYADLADLLHAARGFDR